VLTVTPFDNEKNRITRFCVNENNVYFSIENNSEKKIHIAKLNLENTAVEWIYDYLAENESGNVRKMNYAPADAGLNIYTSNLRENVLYDDTEIPGKNTNGLFKKNLSEYSALLNITQSDVDA
jgi:hypothetical protein